jgi:hypothetical protein
VTAAVGRHRVPAGEHEAGARFRPPDDGLGHELARMRAKLTNPETARADLAEQLRFAHIHADRPPLSALGKAVGYSKATLSKVLSGKMLPTWVLVRDLGMQLGVPPETVEREWFPLWTAAHLHRSRSGAGRARADVAARSGHPCGTCGSWVVDPALHRDWHRSALPAGLVRAVPLERSS